ncbi:MAG: hypothetical protein KUL77_06530 [Thermomonas sp.]|uniref:hypothetical protein n=1 Tax=Thermomonas sp. TaxID=1971895 RepID=UPI001EB9452A|nr:hypothetical protein [Thermomonas sp.]MBV2209202.1 hypothetical protein [Thermomonas sp.]
MPTTTNLSSGISAEQFEHLPPDYKPLFLILGFEDDCQFNGWGAVENAGPEKMDAIIACYSAFGLKDEAAALAAGLVAYKESGDAQEAIGGAYGAVPNATPEMEDRMAVIIDVIKSEPELFAQSSTGG